MADTNRIKMSYQKESSWGAAPGGAMTNIRMTSESIKQTTETVESQEIRSDRQLTDVKRTSITAAGDINFEVSAGSHDDFLEAGMMGTWASNAAVTALSIDAASADNSINDASNGLGSFIVGQWIKVSGFINSENNGYFRVTSVTPTKLVVTGGTLVLEGAAGQTVTIKGQKLVNGTAATSFAIEKEFTDQSNEFTAMLGMMVSGFSLDIPLAGLATGSFTFLGKSETTSPATISNGTKADVSPFNEIINTTDNIKGTYEGGVIAPFTTTSINLAVTNNLRDKQGLGLLGGPQSIGVGSLGVTGTLQAYFFSRALYDIYLNQTTSKLAFVIEDGAGNGYVIDLPRLKFTDGTQVAGSKDADLIVDMSFTAYMDPTELKTMSITRF